MAVSTRALKQMAIFWGIVSGSGSLLMYCLMQNKLANTEAYKQSLQRLEEHSEATAALGTPPLRTHYVSLSDVKRNHLDASIAQLCIPVSGALSSGMLRTRSVRDAHTGVPGTLAGNETISVGDQWLGSNLRGVEEGRVWVQP
uniref:cytochrome c oxidase assembly factor 1 homolog isoform X3 n=1 Tax=Myxine glutinosa TaxID=7769 RepID=UPI00358FE01A